MSTDDNKQNDECSPAAFPNFFTKKDNAIAIYTALRILRDMKQQLGMEAMHEYLDNYIREVNKNNPKLSLAVGKALSLMSVEKMYKDACCEKEC